MSSYPCVLANCPITIDTNCQAEEVWVRGMVRKKDVFLFYFLIKF